MTTTHARRNGGEATIDAMIGARLRTRRLELGLSQEKLGDSLSLTFQQVQKYEKGANRVSSSRLVTLADVLKVDIDYFLGDLSGTKARKPSEFAKFMATKDGAAIIDAMIKLKPPARRAVIDLARGLGSGIEV